MSILHILAGPVIGGIIGYFTNYIAIRMLFRPLKPVYIGPFRVPFTPGIVPRRKDELAQTLGRSIVDRFFNADDLEVIFTSDYLRNAFAESLTDLLTAPGVTLESMGKDLPEQKALAGARERAEEEICVRILAGVLNSDLADVIAKEGGRVTKEFFGDSVVGKLLNDETLASVAKAMKERIDRYLLTGGKALVMPILDKELRELAQEPTADLVDAVFGDRELLKRLLGALYERFMHRYVRPIVETIDVGGMITEKVVQMSAGDIETLVLSVVNKELRYVIWLGALLGVAIGTVNIFI